MTANIIVKCIIYHKHLGRFLLVQRSPHDDIGADTWENAGGNIEDGESPEQAVYREVREETGITDLQIRHIAYVSMIAGERPDLLIVYLCETQTESVRISAEHQAYVWADEKLCRTLLPQAIIRDFETNHVFDLPDKGNDDIAPGG